MRYMFGFRESKHWRRDVHCWRESCSGRVFRSMFSRENVPMRVFLSIFGRFSARLLSSFLRGEEKPALRTAKNRSGATRSGDFLGVISINAESTLGEGAKDPREM